MIFIFHSSYNPHLLNSELSVNGLNADTIKKIPVNWKKIFTRHIADNKLVIYSCIYNAIQTHTHTYVKNTKDLIETWVKALNRYSMEVVNQRVISTQENSK